MQYDETTVTAYHEAGHVLFAEWYGARVIFASIIPSDETGIRSHGETRAIWRASDDAKQRGQQLAEVALAGPVAEMIYTDEQYEPVLLREWWTDWLAAGKAIQQTAERELSKAEILTRLSQTVGQLIEVFSRDEVWDQLARVAETLEAHETLEDDQLCELRGSGFFA